MHKKDKPYISHMFHLPPKCNMAHFSTKFCTINDIVFKFFTGKAENSFKRPPESSPNTNYPPKNAS